MVDKQANRKQALSAWAYVQSFLGRGAQGVWNAWDSLQAYARDTRKQ